MKFSNEKIEEFDLWLHSKSTNYILESLGGKTAKAVLNVVQEKFNECKEEDE